MNEELFETSMVVILGAQLKASSVTAMLTGYKFALVDMRAPQDRIDDVDLLKGLAWELRDGF